MLANANLRLAISNAIDREALVKNYVDDGSEATYTAVPPHYALSATTGEDFSADQAMFSAWVGYDPKRAQEFFEHAKAELKTDAFEFTLIYSNNEGDEIEKVVQAIKEQVEHHLMGLTLNLQGMTKSERVAKLMSGNFDVALTRWAPDYADPMTFLGMWVASNSSNYGRWSSEEYDRIIADCTKGRLVSDYDARWAALHNAESLVMREAVIAPLFTKADASLINPAVQDVEFHPVGVGRAFKNARVT